MKISMAFFNGTGTDAFDDLGNPMRPTSSPGEAERTQPRFFVVRVAVRLSDQPTDVSFGDPEPDRRLDIRGCSSLG